MRVLLIIDDEDNVLLPVKEELRVEDITEDEGALLLGLGGGSGLLEDEELLGGGRVLEDDALLDGDGVLEVGWLLGGDGELLDGGVEVAGAAELSSGE